MHWIHNSRATYQFTPPAVPHLSSSPTELDEFQMILTNLLTLFSALLPVYSKTLTPEQHLEQIVSQTIPEFKYDSLSYLKQLNSLNFIIPIEYEYITQPPTPAGYYPGNATAQSNRTITSKRRIHNNKQHQQMLTLLNALAHENLPVSLISIYDDHQIWAVPDHITDLNTFSDHIPTNKILEFNQVDPQLRFYESPLCGGTPLVSESIRNSQCVSLPNTDINDEFSSSNSFSLANFNSEPLHLTQFSGPKCDDVVTDVYIQKRTIVCFKSLLTNSINLDYESKIESKIENQGDHNEL